jgi:hypothetical protein
MPNQKVNSANHSKDGEMKATIFKKYQEKREKHLSSLTNAEVARHTGVQYGGGGQHIKRIQMENGKQSR